MLARRSLIGRLHAWELWSLPRPAMVFVLAVDALYLTAGAAGGMTTPIRGSDLMTFAALGACGVLSIEASLRLVWRRPSTNTASNNLLAVWTIPVVLLLPPIYSVAITACLMTFVHIRLYRGSLTKLFFNVACGGLAGFAASTVHGAMVSQSIGWSVDRLVSGPGPLLATVTCVLVRGVANIALVGEVIALAEPRAQVKKMILDGELWGSVGAESCIGVLVAVAYAASPFALLFCIVPVLVLQRTLLLAEFREAARTDPKTGLANSSYWREVAERELARARSGSENLAVLLVDVDHFKSVNDRFGHLTGDEVLRTVASGLTHGLRPHDLVGRFGGEEFVVLLVGSDLDQAQHAAERIREHIATLYIDVLNKQEPAQVTVSVGVAAFRESGHSIHELLDAADGALYAAKHAGRNCVRTALGTRQQVLDLTDNEPRVIDLRTHPARVE